MKARFRTVTSVLGAAALTGAVMIGVATPAAAVVPPYEPNPTYNLGTLAFYDAAGTAVTSGDTDDAPFAKFAVASSDDPQTANTVATLFEYTPQSGVDAGLWSGEQLSANTTFPVPAGGGVPAVVSGAGAHRPVVTLGAADLTLADYIADFPNNASGNAYEGLYQLRLRTAGNDPKYWVADIKVTGSTWALVFPQTSTADASSMTNTPNKTVNYGASTTTSTTVTDTDSSTPVASAAVKLYKRPTASAPWAFVADATTNASGVASKSVTPTGKTLYEWRYAGDGGHQAATSPTQTVSVKQVVSAHSTKSSVKHGVAVKIYGTVKPASAGKTVTLQRRAGTHWKAIGTATIKKQKLPNSTTTVGFVFTVRQAAKGTFHYRVAKAATASLLAGTSSALTVRVT